MSKERAKFSAKGDNHFVYQSKRIPDLAKESKRSFDAFSW